MHTELIILELSNTGFYLIQTVRQQSFKTVITIACSTEALGLWGRSKKRADEEWGLEEKRRDQVYRPPLFSAGSRSSLISLVVRPLFRSSPVAERLEQSIRTKANNHGGGR